MNLKTKKIVFWGTYDTGKPRVRLLIKGAKKMGLEVIECHYELWSGIEDKSQIHGKWPKIKKFLLLLKAYPYLIYKYFQLPSHDMVMVGYMGQLDVLFIWPFARLRGVPIGWDIFISLYDTVVIDRKIIKKDSLIAHLLYLLEWFSSRVSDLMLMDTRAHAEYFENLYKLPNNSVKTVYVGSEEDNFYKVRHLVKKNKKFTILFYGQFIPLHGIEVIVKAAKIAEDKGKDLRWIIIGKGQEQIRIDKLIKHLDINSIHRIAWVPYKELINHISQADVCLGIFGASGKATRVIPNKVFQILASKKPLITAKTKAMEELFKENGYLKLIEPKPEILCDEVLKMKKNIKKISNETYPKVFDSSEIGKQFYKCINLIKCRY